MLNLGQSPHTQEAEALDPALSTNALVASAVEGDTVAFRKLVEQHQRYVFAIAFGLMRSDDAAAEIAQDAFVRAWKNLGSYDGRAKFTTWLYKIVVNLCYDRMKSEQRSNSMLASFRARMESTGTAAEDPLTVLLRSDECRRVMEVAATLPPKQRLVFHLRDVNDCSMEEIAEIANMSTGTVKTNLSYARKAIRQQLQREDADHGKIR